MDESRWRKTYFMASILIRRCGWIESVLVESSFLLVVEESDRLMVMEERRRRLGNEQYLFTYLTLWMPGYPAVRHRAKARHLGQPVTARDFSSHRGIPSGLLRHTTPIGELHTQ